MEKKLLQKYINSDWYEVLKDFLETEKFEHILNVLKISPNVLPSSVSCFRAFNCSPYKKTKVLILGQDPYHTVNEKGESVANGLAFASGVYGYTPPSLKSILKEANTKKVMYDLYEWADQGVLLLNTALTVEKSNPGVHTELWKPFTEYTLKKINEEKKNLIVMLWGKKAKEYKPFLTNQIILEAGHPSPLNTSKEKFAGCNHFEICNQELKKLGKSPIIW